ncbi:hypothetical protein REPUB_Repub14bG0014700 [Reevesia pubescens]
MRQVIRYDHHTEEASCGRFARICMELDITKPLVSKIRIGKQIHRVEYKGLILFAFTVAKLVTSMILIQIVLMNMNQLHQLILHNLNQW